MEKVNSLTVLINTYNEEHNIVDCIKSAQLLSSSIIITDMESTDKTVTLARHNDAEIYSFPYSSYVEKSRKFSIERAQSDWIFILDADERVTKELADEILSTIHNTPHGYFRVPRKELFGKTYQLNHGGWWPNYQLRLFRKQSFVDWPTAIHSTPVFKGSMGTLNNFIIHYSQNDFETIVNKTIIFENAESDLLFKANKPVQTSTFFRKFIGEFYRRFIKRTGFRDGNIGLLESLYQAFSKTITYIYLYEKKKKSSSL